MLRIGQVVTLDIELPIAAQAQEVTISAAAPMIQTGRASVGELNNRAEIDNLPNNWPQLSRLLAHGLGPDGPADTRLNMSQDAVREFQVVTNQFAPEFGNSGRGLVNIVSRSGKNGYHGNLFLFARSRSSGPSRANSNHQRSNIDSGREKGR